jgi:hypothetical protein
MPSADLIWMLVSFFLTVLVLSYIFGDNPLFRIATYLFVGVAAGYVAVIIVQDVIVPRMILPIFNRDLEQSGIALLSLVLSAMLLTKLSPRYAWLGSLPMAYLVGAAAAIVIYGALFGTLWPQVAATIGLFAVKSLPAGSDPALALFSGGIVLIGTVTTLAYFHFGMPVKTGRPVERSKLLSFLGRVGQVFIAITLGAIFAGVFASALAALIERLSFLVSTVTHFLH